MKMADLILPNGEKIAKFVKINPLQNNPLYGTLQMYATHSIKLVSVPL